MVNLWGLFWDFLGGSEFRKWMCQLWNLLSCRALSCPNSQGVALKTMRWSHGLIQKTCEKRSDSIQSCGIKITIFFMIVPISSPFFMAKSHDCSHFFTIFHGWVCHEFSHENFPGTRFPISLAPSPGDFSSGYSGTIDLKCMDNVTTVGRGEIFIPGFSLKKVSKPKNKPGWWLVSWICREHIFWPKVMVIGILRIDVLQSRDQAVYWWSTHDICPLRGMGLSSTSHWVFWVICDRWRHGEIGDVTNIRILPVRICKNDHFVLAKPWATRNSSI